VVVGSRALIAIAEVELMAGDDAPPSGAMDGFEILAASHDEPRGPTSRGDWGSAARQGRRRVERFCAHRRCVPTPVSGWRLGRIVLALVARTAATRLAPGPSRHARASPASTAKPHGGDASSSAPRCCEGSAHGRGRRARRRGSRAADGLGYVVARRRRGSARVDGVTDRPPAPFDTTSSGFARRGSARTAAGTEKVVVRPSSELCPARRRRRSTARHPPPAARQQDARPRPCGKVRASE
jgi:hypothetical protein